MTKTRYIVTRVRTVPVHSPVEPAESEVVDESVAVEDTATDADDDDGEEGKCQSDLEEDEEILQVTGGGEEKKVFR